MNIGFSNVIYMLQSISQLDQWNLETFYYELEYSIEPPPHQEIVIIRHQQTKDFVRVKLKCIEQTQ